MGASVNSAKEVESERGESIFFYGSSTHRLSGKGQVALPKRFRATVPDSHIAEGFVLVMGEGCCLYMYTHRQFGIIKGRVRELAEAEGEAEFFRRFMESTFAVDLDAQGRFVIPPRLREDAKLTAAEAVLIGMDDRIELWDPAQRKLARGDDELDAGRYEEERQNRARRIFGL